MQLNLRIFPSKADRPRLGIWIFCLAWLLGNLALIMGLNLNGGELPAACIFAIACAGWWWGYAAGGAKSRIGLAIGLVALALWTLNLLGVAVSGFHFYVTSLFFWCAAGTLLVLIAAVVISEVRGQARPRA
jgi:hypothetical protein